MNYLIIPKDGDPFYTNWFDEENSYNEGDIVINLETGEFYKGDEWEEIEYDHL